ncbi:MAG TPA: AAA family ATPase [Phenylobacterium sp.]|nr:AAA family ATPase [Phenylobacterium sp.]
MIAGPNGSGKTTLTRQIFAEGRGLGEYINPDEIALGLSGGMAERSRAAQAEADRRRAAALAAGRSFAFETVMSHPSKLDVMREARAQGYEFTLYFVGLNHPYLNIDRVRARVRRGGHDVPEDRILGRYERTMALLPTAFEIADRAFVFDNTDSEPAHVLRLVVAKQRGKLIELWPPVPDWVHERLLSKLGA